MVVVDGGDMLLLFMQMVDYPLPFFFYPSFTFPSITNFSITQTIHVLHKLAALFVVKEGRSIKQKEWGPFDIFTRHWICGSVFTNILYQTAVDKRWTTQQTQTIPIINERKSSCIYKSSAQSVHGKSRVKWDYFWPHENLLGHDLNMISLEFCVFHWKTSNADEEINFRRNLLPAVNSCHFSVCNEVPGDLNVCLSWVWLFRFEDYPLDSHICKFRVGSSSHNDQKMKWVLQNCFATTQKTIVCTFCKLILFPR